MKRSHRGIAATEAHYAKLMGKSAPVEFPKRERCQMDPDYAKKRCRNCGYAIMYVRRSRRSVGHWQHVGDGLAQWRSW